jgi:diaminopimelate decarboxylase/aspartate kinase
VVLEFGAAGLSGPEGWRTVADLVRRRTQEGLRPLLVLPALPRTAELILELIAFATPGRKARDPREELQRLHADLARGLGLDEDEAESLLRQPLDELARLAILAGAEQHYTRGHAAAARAMSLGGLMLSRLAMAWLNREGIPAGWHDARTSLLVPEEEGRSPRGVHLAAHEPAPDESLVRRLAAQPRVVVTQGGVAGTPGTTGAPGERTVLLDPGGVDLSAAWFAVKLRAERCEIWGDVPGLFTADPALLPSARLLRALTYEEAQEILTTTGGRGVHPRAVAPLRRRRIPLHLGWIERPGAPGTVISAAGPVTGPQVKAVVARTGVTLISMETVGMWREAGFLARVFEVFARHRVSVGAVSTSETNVTVTLDPDRPETDALDERTVEGLLRDLAGHCEARVIAPTAALSLIGRGIRAILHELGPALEVFEEKKVHLVTESASDLNLTFVVDEDQSERMVRQLHDLLFQHRSEGPVFGSTWQELLTAGAAGPAAAAPAAWWRERRDELLALAAEETPLYVYDAETLAAKARAVLGLRAVDRVFYSVKANHHAGILGLFHGLGLGFECVSIGEVELLRTLLPDLDGARLLFTPNFAPREEYRRALAAGAHVTIDSLHPLREWPETFSGRDLFLRLDPGHGRGHHVHVRTAGAQSKFGIAPEEVEEAAALAERCGARIVGLHAHAGSGIRTAEAWSETARFLAAAARRFPHLRALDLGGGLGVPERPGQAPLDLAALNSLLRACRRQMPGLELWLEPGRYLVAQAGVLLARVVQIKRKGDVTYVGVDAGMNSLIRPALYGSYHPIYNLSRLDEPPELVAHVVGPICETGDVLGRSRRLAPAREGNVLLIDNAGAYGRVMSSRYNLREPAAERLLGRRAKPRG